MLYRSLFSLCLYGSFEICTRSSYIIYSASYIFANTGMAFTESALGDALGQPATCSNKHSADALREAGEGVDWRPVVTRAVGVIEDADVDARARAARVAKRVREELDARERERGTRLEALAERRSEAAAASNRASSSAI